MSLSAPRTIVLLSKYHGSNQQLLALAHEISGENVVTLDCDVRSRSRILLRLYMLAIWLKKRVRADSFASKLISRLFLKGDISCEEGDMVIAKTRPFEVPLQLMIAGTGASSCYIGSPRRFDVDDYDYLVSTPSTPSEHAQFKLDVLPTSFTYEQFRLAEEKQAKSELTTWTMLIGGDARGCKFVEGDWQALIAFIIKASVDNGIYWRISASPRTGENVELLLKEFLIQEHGFKGELYLWRLDSVDCPKPFDLLLNADCSFVTEDSASMISEAANARLPLVTLSPSQGEVSNSLTVPLLEHLEKKGALLRKKLNTIQLADVNNWSGSSFRPLKQCWSILFRS